MSEAEQTAEGSHRVVVDEELTREEAESLQEYIQNTTKIRNDAVKIE
jgi:hypothetical protein